MQSETFNDKFKLGFVLDSAYCKNCKTHFTELEGVSDFSLKEDVFKFAKDLHDKLKSAEKCKFSQLVVVFSNCMIEVREEKKLANLGCWEAVADEGEIDEKQGQFWRVRWSIEFPQLGFLYVKHYGGNGSAMNETMARNDAQRMNERNEKPNLLGVL